MNKSAFGSVDGWGEEETDGTWTAYCRISTGIHSVTTHARGLKSEKEAEQWSRARASEAHAIIRKNGADIRKRYDCRIEAVK